MNLNLEPADFSLFLEGKAQVNAPMDWAFTALCDHRFFAARAAANGVTVTSPDTPDTPFADRTWQASGPFRGRPRTADISIKSIAAPVRLQLISTVSNIEAHTDIEFLETGRRRTRMKIRVGLLPRSMTARLIVQSLRFSRPRLTRRLDKATTRFAKMISRRARQLRDQN